MPCDAQSTPHEATVEEFLAAIDRLWAPFDLIFGPAPDVQTETSDGE